MFDDCKSLFSNLMIEMFVISGQSRIVIEFIKRFFVHMVMVTNTPYPVISGARQSIRRQFG